MPRFKALPQERLVSMARNRKNVGYPILPGINLAEMIRVLGMARPLAVEMGREIDGLTLAGLHERRGVEGINWTQGRTSLAFLNSVALSCEKRWFYTNTPGPSTLSIPVYLNGEPMTSVQLMQIILRAAK